jgi:tripartite-type tricarboxylate transporter receptor subunit TctC
VIQALHDQVVHILAQEEVQAQLDAVAVEPIGSTPEQLQSLVAAEGPRWASLIRAAGIKPN